MSSWIDVRSDTVTQPTPAMRQAMFDAVVGDDVYQDDPTVQALEQAAALKLGKDAALFVPTGNFGNQLALLTHCERGNEVILGEDCHIIWHETGGAAVIAGVQLRALVSHKGQLDPIEIEKRIRVGQDIHWPKTGLICVENSHSCGRVLPLSNMQAIFAVGQKHKVPVHLDGARLFNAATYLNVDVKELAACADSVMLCLSKGLAAPVGSLLLGSHDFIKKARYFRKLLGGGMRQSGVLAAPGLIALNEMSLRLHEDHQRAQHLAHELAKLPGIDVDLEDVHINMVWFKVGESINIDQLMQALQEAQIKANPPENGLMRIVTHWQIDDAALSRIIDVFKRLTQTSL